MKSVLIGADIIQLEDGYKLLEINTDTDLYKSDVEYIDLVPFFDYLVQNSYTKLVLIYKNLHISEEVINLYQSKCDEHSITMDKIVVMNNSVTVPSISEESNTFYLRMAYDVTAIIDDTYCRDKSEIVKLFTESNDIDVIPKTYVKYTEDNSILDNLTNLVNNGMSPNVIAKKVFPDFDRVSYPAFFKVNSDENLTNLKNTLPENIMLQEFRYNSTNLSTNGQINDIIRIWVILLSDVETMIPMGLHRTNSQIPLNEEIITYTDNKLDNKWRAMYFSNPNMFTLGVPGTYEVIQIVDGNEVVVPIDTLNVNDIVKSVELVDLNANANMNDAIKWSSSLDLPSLITYHTASVAHITKEQYEGWLVNLEYGKDGITGSTELGPTEVILVRDYTTKDIKLKPLYEITTDDKVITSHDFELDITSKNDMYYSGSLVTLEIIPDHVFLAGTNVNDINKNAIGNIIIHNKCAWDGFCCFANDTLVSSEFGNKLISEIQVGEKVWSFNFETNEKELKEVIDIQSPMHDDIVEIKFTNGTIIKNTFDHPYYNENGKLMSYNPEKTMKWISGDVLPMTVGTKCIDIDGNIVEIETIKEEIKEIQTYTLFVKDNKNFYANNVLVYDEEK